MLKMIPVHIIDLADPNKTEHLGYLRSDKIVGVRPAQIVINMEDVKRDNKIIPVYKKFTHIYVDGVGHVPSSDPVDALMKRINDAASLVVSIPVKANLIPQKEESNNG